MKFIYCCLYLLLTSALFSQMECTEIRDLYLKEYPKDSSILIGNEIIYFCQGALKAQKDSALAISSVGDPGHASSCTFESYSIHGVRRYFSGDIIMEGDISRNLGYNFIMEKRIKEELGDSIFNLLGKVDSNWIEFNQSLAQDFTESFDYKVISDSSVWVKIDTVKLSQTRLQSIEGIEFLNHLSGKKFNDKEIVEGIFLRVRGGDKYLQCFLRFNLKNYNHPTKHVCTYNSLWTVPIRFLRY